MNRYGICLPLFLLVLGCSDDGGPSGPEIPNIAGQWTGVPNFVVDTCTQEGPGPRPEGTVTITQSGSTFTLIVPDQYQIMGTVESSGAFHAAGQVAIEGIPVTATLDGQVTGDTLTGMELLDAGACSITVTFTFTRE